MSLKKLSLKQRVLKLFTSKKLKSTITKQEDYTKLVSTFQAKIKTNKNKTNN